MPDGPLVLVIDDDAEIVRGLRIRLGAAGYQVLTAGDGERGLTTAIEDRPDAILLDIRMPGMDGLAVLAELRNHAETRSIPVVVMSANVVEQTRQKALALGARYFVAKPYPPQTLMAALSSAMTEPSPVGGECRVGR